MLLTRKFITVVCGIIFAAMPALAIDELPQSDNNMPSSEYKAATSMDSTEVQLSDDYSIIGFPTQSTSIPPSFVAPESSPYGINLHLPAIQPDPSMIAGWNGGEVTGNVQVKSLPGMMTINQGRITLTQRLGNVSISAYGEGVKYGYFRGLTTSWGYGGEITWRPSGKIAFTLFGAYYTPLTLRTAPNSSGLRPEMVDFLSVTRFGGYADISLGENWGIMVGAQAYRGTSSGSMEVVPIATPYYKINGKHKIGIDVGGIVYELLRKSNDWGSKNPTIAPPSHPRPPVR